MIYKISDNIVSALGFDTEENFNNIKSGKSGLQIFTNPFGLDGDFCLGKIDDAILDKEFSKIKKDDFEYTKLEKAVILSVYKAAKPINLQLNRDDVLFVFSTTKGNVDFLENGVNPISERAYLWKTAEIVCDFFNNKAKPIVVSNACVSGIVAQIVADRNLSAKRYKYAIVCGFDILSKFTVSGFNSFKALSNEICKPFDINRKGLNIAEGAATIIYAEAEENDIPKNSIIIKNHSICNDANHISGPSRNADGLTICIKNTVKDFDINKISFINAHGTATPYNDNMESIAIDRSGLNDIPVNSLKAYYGHTLGAAGILESILSSKAIQNEEILPSKGFEIIGVDKKINICTKLQKSKKKAFIKLISGFGGTNAAILFEKK